MVNQSTHSQQQTFPAPMAIPGVSFRLAHAVDLPALNENCYPDTDWEKFQDQYNYLLRWQENGRCYILIAEYDENATVSSPIIIGSGQLLPRADKAEIAELAVHPDYRNRGIGTAMIHILTQIARERQNILLEISAAIENEAALRLYRRLGFGRERLIRLPTNQEAIILNKNLTPEY